MGRIVKTLISVADAAARPDATGAGTTGPGPAGQRLDAPGTDAQGTDAQGADAQRTDAQVPAGSGPVAQGTTAQRPIAWGPGAGAAFAPLPTPLLREYAGIAWRRRWPMLAVLAACLLGALLVTLALPSQYTARTQLEISREQKRITNVEGLESRDAGRDLEFYATQYALLTTRPVAARVVSELGLATSPAFFARDRSRCGGAGGPCRSRPAHRAGGSGD